MEVKPNSSAGYRASDYLAIVSTCLYVATKLGDYRDDMVIVGGLVPSLLVDQTQSLPNFESHSGTMDLDVGLSLAILDEKRYEGLTARLRGAGFEPDHNEQGNRSMQRWRTKFDPPVTIDFLIPVSSNADLGGSLKHIERDFAPLVNECLHLAFEDRKLVTLNGKTPLGESASRDIWVCGPGAFTVLKASAFENRGENKDAYDLTYVWRYLGVDQVAKSLIPHLRDPAVVNAIEIIERDFTSHNGVGARRAAEFELGTADDDIQADVVGLANALLTSLSGE